MLLRGASGYPDIDILMHRDRIVPSVFGRYQGPPAAILIKGDSLLLVAGLQSLSGPV